MINPSANGWIDKFFSEQKLQRIDIDHDEYLFYKKIRQTGLVFGYPVSFENIQDFDTENWTKQEFTKVALLVTLYNVFEFQTHEKKYEDFVYQAIRFYKTMNSEHFSLLKKVLPESSHSIELENVIDDRVQTNDSILTRNFSHIITNALLFEDVLAFQQYLIHDEIPENYLKNLEEKIISLVSLGMQTKNEKTDYEALITKLFESSLRYTKFSKTNIQNLDLLDLENISSNLEKYYLMDMAVLSVWNESLITDFEKHYLTEIAKKMNLKTNVLPESLTETDGFLKQHKSEIPYFKYSNPVKHFYDQATETVSKLISRNKTRLVKELSNNRELMLLLTHSAHRSLDAKEKKKIKKQLLEICKTIPSLTIFLLPGGSLLLPLLIKFIPQLLPSAFNENLE